MKTNLFFAALLTLFIFMNIMPACQDKKIEITDLPEPALIFTKKYFPLDSINTITVDTKNKEYKVEFFNHDEISFDPKGVWTEVNVNQNPFPMALFDALPSDIFQYIITAYPQKPISSIQKTAYGYKIEIGFFKKQETKFDLQGNIIK